MMVALAGALVAGALTSLTPCVLPLLPVVVGGSLVPGFASVRRALIVSASLAASVFAFSILLKATTVLIGVDLGLWNLIAGGLLILLGLAGIFPTWWSVVSVRLGLQRSSNVGLAAAQQRTGVLGAALTGAALGPVFSACSPFYLYVVATAIPVEPARGVPLLGAYVVGLSAVLLFVAMLGQPLVRRVRWLADPHGWFRRLLGLVFVVIGIAVAMGLDREIQAWVIQNAPIRPWEYDQRFIPIQ